MIEEVNYRSRLRGSLALLIASFIWGTAFVAQKLGMEYMDPFFFNGTRNLMGAVVLLPVLFFLAKKRGIGRKEIVNKQLVVAGLICGVCLFIASNFQQVGLKYTTAGKAGFITAMYIVLVPIIGLFFGKKIRALLVVSLCIAVAGLYFLCITEGFSVNLGDGLVFLCAISFAFHIIAVDYYSAAVVSVALSCAQFLVNGVLSLIVAFFFESMSLGAIWLAMPALLFAGIGSSGIAFTLQIVGQKRVPPTMASLLMSFESVFAVLGAVVIMKDVMSVREIVGCVLMFIAVILSQLPEKR